MVPAPIHIVSFADKYQSDIDRFMTAVINEFAEPISIRNPKSKNKSKIELTPADRYWVALSGGKAIGTISLTEITNHTIVLKNMFVAYAFRGKGIGKSLLETLLAWASLNKIEMIYLGTMDQFKAAQKFYAKNGFTKIERNALPFDFPINPVDTLFYKMTLQ
jgi:N-acetylglutamate synthase-like GNAT family acetyltransferase